MLNAGTIAAYVEQRQSAREIWNSIVNFKHRFMENRTGDELDCPHLHPEIFQSWVRSRQFGVNPYKKVASEIVSAEDLDKILKRNELLINITKSVFDDLKLKDMMTSKFALFLFDKDGVLLAHEGDPPQITGKNNAVIGIIWTEKTMGTCAHTLTMHLKRPTQIIGPEHYCVAFENCCTVSAPVMDENGNLIASLVLSHHYKNLCANDVFHLNNYPLGLITAMAVAVENRLRSTRSYEMLNKAHHIQKVTLSVIDEGIIVVDHHGQFIHLNNQAAQMLNITPDVLAGQHVKDYFSQQVVEAVASGRSIDIEETLSHNGESSYMICVRPIIGNGQLLQGAVLKLTHIDKINAMVADRSGAVATFTFDQIIGKSTAMKEAITLAKCFAHSSENILLTGESGTGKELFAQAIHNMHRPQGPFIAVNCAAMPRQLIESELFGYEGGSFTGAKRTGRVGKIELANGGTLFLDEIGDMPIELQAVLLRVLEDKKVMRIGGRHYRKVDFRLICATNKDLQQLGSENMFRTDLFFRISTLHVKLPPLREREGDIELLADYFIRKYCHKMKCPRPKINHKTLEILNNYSWPGNVRQLENAVVYALNLAHGKEIMPEHLPDFLFKVSSSGSSLRSSDSGINMEHIYKIDVIERIVIENVLYKTNYNITKSSELLGMAKSTLYRKIKQLNIDIK